jgi:exodeoxyribonuclease V alpha subunit
MKVLSDVHQQFAEYFNSDSLKPYLYLLSKKMSEGHICINLGDINNNELDEHYTFSHKSIGKDDLVSDGTIVKPLILFNNRLYLHRYFNYETVILNRINNFIESEKENKIENENLLKEKSELINILFENSNQNDLQKEEINWQLIAAINVVLNNFTIITGGPGTGKTTTVAKILTILFSINPQLKVALAAPTGKAAARMAESLKNTLSNTQIPVTNEIKEKFETLEPSTIHRLLGYKRKSIYFKNDKQNPLNYDVIIIDESSMIDVALFAKLLDATGPETKLILLGDKDQLASVEAGSLFGDLCQAQGALNLFSKEKMDFINSFITHPEEQLTNKYLSDSTHPLFEHIIELQKSHRFSDDKGIGKFSKAIIQNDEQVIKYFFKNEDEQVNIDEYYSDKVFNNIIDGYSDYIKEENILLALKKLNNLKVLCAIREGEHGLYAINKKIENYLAKKKLIKLTGEFYENRPIIVNSNDYESGLFNGDVGIVRPDENGELKVWFEIKGEVRAFLPSSISNAETVLAMTIHKSQGSEFDKVMVILPQKEDIKILTRELLYTAVTRAKSQVTIQASHEIILQTVKESVKRGSGIIQRFV